MGFGVVGHPHRHGDVAALVDVHMAIAVQVLDDGHFGARADALDQALAAARNDHINILRHGDQVTHGSAVGDWHQLHHVFGQPGTDKGALHQSGQRLV